RCSEATWRRAPSSARSRRPSAPCAERCATSASSRRRRRRRCAISGQFAPSRRSPDPPGVRECPGRRTASSGPPDARCPARRTRPHEIEQLHAGTAVALPPRVGRAPTRRKREMEDEKRKKVLCPVTGKDNKTYWMRLGTAFVNKDNSINVYLDASPYNGKLQIRDWDDPRERQQHFANLAVVPQPRAAAAANSNDDIP